MNQSGLLCKIGGGGRAKQYAGLRLESFSKHQNDPLLNSTFKEGLDEDLATLV